jgi:ferric-dicitrate binding protein FerR (iron transport regulator)
MLLLDRGAGESDTASRLALEAHLGECPSCAEAAARLNVLGRTMRGASHELPPRRRDRAIERALRAASNPQRVVERRSRRWVASVLAAAAVVALAASAAWLRRAAAEESLTSVGTSLTNFVESVEITSHEPRRGSDIPGIDAPAGTRLDLDGAIVETLQPSQLAWRRQGTTLELRAGAVRVDVTRKFNPPFRVTTPRFIVEVVGTAFDVDLEQVSVKRGRVRVTRLSGEELARALGPGESYASRPIDEPAPRTVASVEPQIERARKALAAGRSGRARELLRAVSRASLDGRQRAEVGSLLAECARLDGDHAEAARAYGEVADRHPDTLAGETALFTKARAEIDARRTDAARSSLKRYLERYPNGRFRKEAQRYLASLEKTR